MINTRSSQSIHVPVLIAGIAAILLSTVAMTVAREGLPETPAAPLTEVRSDPDAGEGRARARCGECGIIESMRQVALKENSPALYEITVRMRDGTTRVLSDTGPPNWRRGERTILIGGANEPAR